MRTELAAGRAALPVLRLLRGIAAVACVASTPGVAQPSEELVERPLTLSLQQVFTYDDNLYRLPASVSPAAFGATERSDLISTTSVGARFERELSRQRVSLGLSVGQSRFQNNPRLDNTSYSASASLGWALGTRWWGVADAQRSQFLSSFADLLTGQRNVVDSQLLNLDVRYRLDPWWSAIAGVDATERRNSLPLLVPANNSEFGVEGGLRLDTGRDSNMSLVLRRVDGRFPDRVRNAFVDDAYTQDRVALRTEYALTGASRLEGEVGWTRRDFVNLARRAFAGPTASLTWRWNPVEAWFVDVGVGRDLAAVELVNANFADTRRTGARVLWRQTAKWSWNATAERRWISFDGDPGFATASAQRADRLDILAVGLAWTPTFSTLVTADLRRESRRSTLAALLFDATVATVSAQLRF